MSRSSISTSGSTSARTGSQSSLPCAPLYRFDKPTHDLHVLLRHRLLRQPHGFEGIVALGPVALRPAVSLPLLDPAKPKLAHAFKPVKHTEPRHIHARSVDLEIGVIDVKRGSKTVRHVRRNGFRVAFQRCADERRHIDALERCA